MYGAVSQIDDVLRLRAEGLTRKQIADELCISPIRVQSLLTKWRKRQLPPSPAYFSREDRRRYGFNEYLPLRRLAEPPDDYNVPRPPAVYFITPDDFEDGEEPLDIRRETAA